MCGRKKQTNKKQQTTDVLWLQGKDWEVFPGKFATTTTYNTLTHYELL